MVDRGEVRRASSWPSVGSEPTGDHLILIMTPDWFNAARDPIAIPLTSRPPTLDYYWETFISTTNSWVPIPGIKTVRSSLVSRSVSGLAGSDDLELIGLQLSRLISSAEATSGATCNRGEVWSANLAPPGTPPYNVDVLVLRYDPRNEMAMTLRVINRQDGPPGLEVPIQSCASLLGKSISAERVWPLSVRHRFLTKSGQLSESETDVVANAFLKLVS